MATSFPYLIELVEASTAGLRDISLRRLFGCDALFVGDNIFVLFWKTGRIGVKLTDAEEHARLLAVPGSEPWRMGPKVAAHWVLVPEEMHDDGEALTPWVRKAYAQVRERAGGEGAGKKVAKAVAAGGAKAGKKVAKAGKKVAKAGKKVAKAVAAGGASAAKRLARAKAGGPRAAGR